MAESAIEETVVNLAEAAGWLVRKLQYPAVRAAPDRMFIKDGRVVFIEFKRPGAIPNRVTLQTRERKKLLAAGAEAHFCDSIEHACEILGIPWQSKIGRLAKRSRSVLSISGPSS